MIQFKKLAQFFRLLKMNSIFSISFDKKKFELFISHRTLQKHIIFSLCFKKNVHLVFMISQRTLQAPSHWNQIRHSWYRTRCIYMYLLFMFIKVNTCKVAKFFTPAKIFQFRKRNILKHKQEENYQYKNYSFKN